MHTLETMQIVQLLERLERLGVDPGEVCKRSGIDASRLGDVDSRLPFGLALAAVREAQHLTGDPLIALRAAMVRPPRGLLIHQFRAQPTLKAAIEQLARNAPLSFSPLSAELEVGTRSARLCFRFDDAPSDALDALQEYVAGFATRFLWETSPTVTPSEVRLAHAPRAPAAEYERLLRAPVRFHAPEYALVLPPDRIMEPIATANPVVARVIGEQIEGRLVALASGEVRASVAHAIEQLLRESRPVARNSVARRLGLSVRTLQRRLADEGVSFRAVREAELERMARGLLALPNVALVEVAQRTGFADEEVFAKAWKRWTGETPRETRRRVVTKPG